MIDILWLGAEDLGIQLKIFNYHNRLEPKTAC
jgi:hypothetical protein